MLPKYLKPMEPILVQEPPEGDTFLHSVKWDGVRQIVYVDGNGLRIHNRKLKDRTDVYPELKVLEEMVEVTGVVFDGEVIALGEDGRPDFQLVMRRDNCRTFEAVGRTKDAVPIFYMVFDLLYYEEQSIMDLPLTERLNLLEEVLPNPSPPIQLVEHAPHGKELFLRTGDLGLEGVVSKDKGSRYVQGAKSEVWKKAKHFRDMEVVVGGFTVKKGLLNSLSVGAYGKDGRLYFLGNVSTGLSQHDIRVLDSHLRSCIQPNSPFADYQKKHPSQVWTMPLLTLKVKYLEITGDGRLRHPVVLGFVSVDPRECTLVPKDH